MTATSNLQEIKFYWPYKKINKLKVLFSFILKDFLIQKYYIKGSIKGYKMTCNKMTKNQTIYLIG
jgi:hypothetical protein